MINKHILRLGAKRLVMLFVISLAVVWAVSELAFAIQKEQYDRPPEQVELLIPAGTSQRVKAGEPAPSIPEEMVFVLGDTLLVNNQDAVDHQLGPVWVPSGAQASLVLEEPGKFAYSCSFQPGRYLGLDVRKPTTWGTRLTALGLATPALAFFLFVYSLILRPVHVNSEDNEVQKPTIDDPSPKIPGDSISP